MSSYQLQSNESESLLLNVLQNNDPSMDDLFAQFTTETEIEVVSPEAQAISGESNADNSTSVNNEFDFSALENPQAQDNTFEGLFCTPYSSPRDSTPAFDMTPEEAYVSPYAQEPSLTVGSWAPDSTSLSGQYPDLTVTNPFGSINMPIDPALQSFDTFGIFDNYSTLQVPYTEPWLFDSARTPPSANPSWGSSIHSEYLPSRSPSPQYTPGRRGVVRTGRNARPTTPYSKPVVQKKPRANILTAPFSVLTSLSSAPRQHAFEHIHRGIAERHQHAAECRGDKANKIPRPSNSFMLYKMAYKPYISDIARANGNQQAICTVASESWNNETEDVKADFAELALLEKGEHRKAFPDYKYNPHNKGKKSTVLDTWV